MWVEQKWVLVALTNERQLSLFMQVLKHSDILHKHDYDRNPNYKKPSMEVI